MKKNDLVGRRFGKLIVVEDSGERKNASILWRCKCDCGGEILLMRHQLAGGAVTNCGCISPEWTTYVGTEDLTGQQFGILTVTRRVKYDKHNKTRWLCRCKCGNECVVSSVRLMQGKTQSCGCKIPNTFHDKDISGQRFGHLVALFPVNPKQYTEEKKVWHCRCDCGNEVDIAASSLLWGLAQSCGCQNREKGSEMHNHLHDADDTCIERLARAQKNEQENKAGFRGLFMTKNGGYRVTVTFQKVHYHLGYFTDFAKAIEALLDAEEVFQAGFVSAYNRWNERAEIDPIWAEENPFVYGCTSEVHDAWKKEDS